MTQYMQAAAGTGEYFSDMNGLGGGASIQPRYAEISGVGEYFSEPMSGFGAYTRPAQGSKLSKIASMSPMLGALGAIGAAAADQAAAEQNGNAPAAAAAGMVLAMVAAGLIVRGVAGYFVGKAVAPHGKEQKYALWGVAASLFLGTVGLGIESVVAMKNQ